ncbi:uncharacterized protein LOC132728391 isoform X2 [Ruditapes philippinarum]|uniref:uncharacterized protein LOC132728391 isoform X2 n=1 Tax=Ruditapes philippinarum TaxID=129788 RepID=UPI00295BE106|nr:uncharacterized protein LOC132728391 isoform X2 [Ruditapes philippinarum]
MDFWMLALYGLEWIEYILYVICSSSDPMSGALFNFRRYEDISSLQGNYKVTDTREKKCFVETSFQDVYRMDGWQILCICEDSCTNEAETAIMFDKLWAENECKERLKIKTNRHKY